MPDDVWSWSESKVAAHAAQWLGHLWALGKGDIHSLNQIAVLEKRLEVMAAASRKIFIVEGVSAVVPGRVMKVFSSEQTANAEAADLVNLIRQQGRMRGARATAENWRAKLSQVQVAREWEEIATVEVTEVEVLP